MYTANHVHRNQQHLQHLVTGQKLARSKCLQLVEDRDKAVRAAALDVMETAYQQEGNALWRLLGKLSPKQRGYIEERLKYTDRQANAQVCEFWTASKPTSCMQHTAGHQRVQAGVHRSGGKVTQGVSNG